MLRRRSRDIFRRILVFSFSHLDTLFNFFDFPNPAGLGMPGMAGMGGLGGMGGMGLMGSALGGNLAGIQTGGVGGNDKDADGTGNAGVTADATTSGAANPMLQQNLLMQQLLAQQQASLTGVPGSLWQQCK